MSRYYEITIDVEDITDPLDIEVVEGVIREHWQVDDTWSTDSYFSFNGRSYLAGGESESEFADRISKEIWRAMGRYEPITVHATCLEDVPCEEHYRSQEDYDRLTK